MTIGIRIASGEAASAVSPEYDISGNITIFILLKSISGSRSLK
jgi:hypothetical protein